jgi:hypothetical protein
MNGGKRKLSSWNIFVKKIYHEGHSKNKNYSFKQALSDASKRKSEMGSSSMRTKSRKNSSQRSRSMSLAGGKSRRRSRSSKSRRR